MNSAALFVYLGEKEHKDQIDQNNRMVNSRTTSVFQQISFS